MNEPVYPYVTPPMPHQQAELRASAGKRAWALFWVPGTGKTFVLLHTFGYWWMKGKADCLLAFAPNDIHTNWAQIEVPKHFPPAFDARVIEWDSGRSQTKRFQWQLKDALADTSRPLILCANTEGLQSKRVYDEMRRVVIKRRTMVVVDESADIASASALQSRRMHLLGKLAVARRAADGSPNTESPTDLYGQLRFVDFSVLGVKDFMAFKERYFEMADFDFGGEQPVRLPLKGKDGRPVHQNLDDLRARVARISSRVGKDVLGLPEKTMAPPHYYDVSREQADTLRQLHEEFQAVLPSGETVTAELQIVRDLREQQIICGYVPVDPQCLDPDEPDADPVRLIAGPHPRLDLVMDMVRRYPVKTIIWTRFRLDISTFLLPALQDAGYAVVRYDGDVGKDERAEAKARFQDGDAQILLANPAAMGRGHTLTSGVHAIFYSNYFSLRRRLQAEDRMHRIGLQHTILMSDLIARGTVDERIVRNHRAKEPVAAYVMGDTTTV